MQGYGSYDVGSGLYIKLIVEGNMVRSKELNTSAIQVSETDAVRETRMTIMPPDRIAHT